MLGNTKLSPERKLQRVKISLLRNPKVALMSGILMVGKTFVDSKLPTARTNGKDEWYGEKFIADLKEKELAFVIMHEASHKMYRHLTTWRKLYEENHKLANMACDYVINLMLKDLDPTESFMAMPRDKSGKVLGLIDERFRGMNAKQVFDILKQEYTECDCDDGDGEGFDEHDWDGARELTEDEKKDLEREIDQAIRQGIIADKKVNGDGAGGLARELGELVAPKVDWREQLREFVKSVCAGKDNSSWRKVNRRFIGGGIYMPTLVSERVHHIVPAIDTSGSIGGEELNEFLSELAGICEQVNPELIDLLYWDGVVAGHETYSGADASNIVSSTKPVGGGGTSPSCITAYLKEHKIEPDVAVVLTDGYVGSDWGGDWPCPVLWCIVGGNTVVAPNGKTIHIN
jgi:predicted metal-dependent peptidase